MTEEEFEDMLGVKYGWPEPLGMPRRPTVLPFILWAIVIGLVIAGVLYAGRAFADEQMTMSSKDGSGNLVRITTEACPDAPPLAQPAAR